MSTLFAFLHHVAAFTLVSALAVEFILIGQEFSSPRHGAWSSPMPCLSGGRDLARRRSAARIFLREGRRLLFYSPAFMTKFSHIYRGCPAFDRADTGIPVLAQGVKSRKLPSPSAEKLRFIRKIIHGELAAIIIILLCAAIMARGGWVQRRYSPLHQAVALTV